MTAPAGRLASVDALRGLAIATMILVNNPGSWSHVPAPLRHAEWHGLTLADLVFPFFLFVMGAAIPLALGRRLEAGGPLGPVVGKILRRAAVLFLLGLLLHGFPYLVLRPALGLHQDLLHLRIPGVLQRIAVCYLLASLLFLRCGPRTPGRLAAGILLGYWALLAWVPVPGHGAGRIDGVDTHLPAYLDRLLLSGHLWAQARTWDPEGVLSTLPALATTLLGVGAGRVLRTPLDVNERSRLLLARGFLLLVLGWAWSWLLPLNKSLWTGSYALLTGGLAMSLLGLLHGSLDGGPPPRWHRPLAAYGLNAITVFVLSGLLGRTLISIRWTESAGGTLTLKSWLHARLFLSWLPPETASVAYALAWVLGWYALLAWMHRRSLHLKV